MLCGIESSGQGWVAKFNSASISIIWAFVSSIDETFVSVFSATDFFTRIRIVATATRLSISFANTAMIVFGTVQFQRGIGLEVGCSCVALGMEDMERIIDSLLQSQSIDFQSPGES